MLVLEDGEARDLGAAPWPLDEELLGRAGHAWVWTSRSAPRRIAPRALASTAAVPSDRTLALSVPGLRPGEARELRILAAPAEMWAEVPEGLLPRFPVDGEGTAEVPIDPAGPWRLRMVGTRGSTWIDLPAGSRTATVLSEPADAFVLAVSSATGEPAFRVAVSVVATQPTARTPGVVARFVGDDRGRIAIPSLPASHSLRVVLSQPDHAPLVLTGTPGQLPGRVVLAPGRRLHGRVLQASKEGPPVAVAGARVRVEAWLADDSDALFRRTAATGAEGTWEIRAVPSAPAMVEVRAPDLAPWSRRLEPGPDGAGESAASGLDLGDIVLQPGVTVQVAVVDDLGRPVAGARVEAGPPATGPSSGPIARVIAEGSTDGRGQLRLEALPEGEPLVLRAVASGHGEAVDQLSAPLPARATLGMTRAYQVTGRLTDGDGLPLLEGHVRIQRGSSFRDEPLAPGGTFTLELPPNTPAALTFTSPRSAAITLTVAAGSPGEILDLGEIRAPGGLTVAGTLLDRLDGAPVSGARVWLPRRMEGGPLVAWMLGQVIETTSDADGRFALAGLDPVPDLVRIDARGKARLHLPVQPQPQTPWLEAGELWLDDGAAVRVSLPDGSGRDRGELRADLRNRGLEIDMVTAPVHADVAVVEHLPTDQEITVSVVRGHTVLCEQRVTTPDNGETLELDCADAKIEVSGTVLAGGEPVIGGTLVWSSPPAEEGALILTTASTSGLRRQSLAGAGRPPVLVELDGEGRFVTHDLAAGSWLVIWSPPGGGSAPEIAVEIPALDSFAVTLEIPGRTVQGRVLDPEGRPAERARVRELTRGTTALSSLDGTFTLTGLETDIVQLEARRDALRSPVAMVEAPAGENAAWVELRLEENPDDELLVWVLGTGGEAKGGAFVLLEDERRNLRLLTADRDGRARIRMPPPAPARIRLAALAEGVWAFDSWHDWDPRRAELVIEIGAAGSAVISADGVSGSPAIEGPLGWDVSELLTRIGLRPFVTPEEPLYLAGLPVGRYQVRIGDTTRVLAVEGGETATVELP